jgi:hypothetical protein
MRIRVLEFPDRSCQFDIRVAVVRDGGMVRRQMNGADDQHPRTQQSEKHCLHWLLRIW